MCSLCKERKADYVKCVRTHGEEGFIKAVCEECVEKGRTKNTKLNIN